MSRRIRVKNPNAMHETIEGKVINIDLETSYYSLRDTSAEIWQGIESGADELQIADSLRRRCDASHETTGAAVARYSTSSQPKVSLSRATEIARRRQPRPLQEATGRMPFSAPMLEKHTDMQELILLDPVHKVGPRGWPHAAESEAGD